MIFTITDETAFKLGKFDFPHFYSQARWKVNKEPFELAHFFNWGLGMGWPCDPVTYETDWYNIQLYGSLKTKEIKEIPHKLAYIRGRLQGYSVSITENTISIHYANSYDLRDLLAECLQDVIMDRFVLLPQKEGEPGRSFNSNAPKYNITKNEIVGTIPGTPSVTLEADKEIINYIIGKI